MVDTLARCMVGGDEDSANAYVAAEGTSRGCQCVRLHVPIAVPAVPTAKRREKACSKRARMFSGGCAEFE